MMKHLHVSFGDVQSFLEDEDLPPSRLKLLEILNNAPKKKKLQIELVVTIHTGKQ